jgi:small subunit ribosomal protein S16
MVKIKLRRVGATKQPAYRLVIADSKSSRDGKFINTIGHYNPRNQPEELVINEQQALDWLNKGAQPTATVARLLNKAGILDKFNASKEKP